jgi:hypothetical protein
MFKIGDRVYFRFDPVYRETDYIPQYRAAVQNKCIGIVTHILSDDRVRVKCHLATLGYWDEYPRNLSHVILLKNYEGSMEGDNIGID